MQISLTAVLVGITFLVTGLTKAVTPGGFRSHLYQLGVFPSSQLNTLVALAAAAEAAVATALITGIARSVVLPLTAIVLAALSFITWISVRSGRVSDCGCYGGYIVPSPGQSVLINGILIALLVVSWFVDGAGTAASSTGLIIVAVTTLSFGAFTWFALRHERLYGAQLINLSPLKVGHRWSKRWAGGEEPSGSDELIIAYLGADCPFCKLWTPILNGINENAKLPRVVGVMGDSSRNVEAFRSKNGIRFPVRTVPRSLFNRLVTAVPTAIVVHDGKVDDVWAGALSPQFLKRFTQAFFSTQPA